MSNIQATTKAAIEFAGLEVGATTAKRTRSILDRRFLVLLGLIAILLATLPIFFEIYRTAAFNTVPRDDYANYLLALVGQGGKTPIAPFAYRVFSVAVAAPFYYILPGYQFTNLRNVDPAYLRATEAISFVCYLSLIFTAVVVYGIARQRHGSSRLSALVVALSTFLFAGFIQETGVDPFSILVISLCLYWIEKAIVFVPLMLISIGINEKIALVFAAILLLRLMVAAMRRQSFTLYSQLFASFLAIAGYFDVVALLRVPGNEGQTTPHLFLSNIYSSLLITFSFKGIFLTIIPLLVLLIVAILAVAGRSSGTFHASDTSSIAVLFILGLIANVGEDVGRIVMYSYPFFLPATSAWIDRMVSNNCTLRFSS